MLYCARLSQNVVIRWANFRASPVNESSSGPGFVREERARCVSEMNVSIDIVHCVKCVHLLKNSMGKVLTKGPPIRPSRNARGEQGGLTARMGRSVLSVYVLEYYFTA